jgi:hypothetical protein
MQALISEAMAGEEVVFMRGPKPVPVERSRTSDEQWALEMRAFRGILKGIDTTVPREKDRLM